jgi:TPR repeat protein
MSLYPSSFDPVADAYFAAWRAVYDAAHPEEWTRDAFARQATARAAFREAAEVLKAAAEPGNPEIWHAAAHAAEYADRDDEAALRWERKAAAAGLPAAMVNLALALRREEAHNAEAIQWLERAAALGFARAMTFMGFAYRDGHGVAEDFPTAAAWFRRAVEAGDSHALVLLGRLLALLMDRHEEGLSILLKAAEAGHRDAFVFLADLYADRHSPVHDPVEALKWYHRVAETGGPGSAARAMLELSNRYRDGIGTPPNRAKAREWLVQHAENLLQGSPGQRKAEQALAKFDAELF